MNYNANNNFDFGAALDSIVSNITGTNPLSAFEEFEDFLTEVKSEDAVKGVIALCGAAIAGNRKTVEEMFKSMRDGGAAEANAVLEFVGSDTEQDFNFTKLALLGWSLVKVDGAMKAEFVAAVSGMLGGTRDLWASNPDNWVGVNETKKKIMVEKRGMGAVPNQRLANVDHALRAATAAGAWLGIPNPRTAANSVIVINADGSVHGNPPPAAAPVAPPPPPA
jgi:primase-polymerase (primpol)-like protein